MRKVRRTISEISIAQRFVQNLSENSVQSIELSASFKFKTRKRAWLNYLQESDSMAIDRSYVANETRPRIAVDRREESWPSEIYFDDEGQNKTFDFNRLKSTLWKRSKRVEESRKGRWKKKMEKEKRREGASFFILSDKTATRNRDGDRINIWQMRREDFGKIDIELIVVDQRANKTKERKVHRV